MSNTSAAWLGMCVALAAGGGEVERWALFEIKLDGPAAGNPDLEVRLAATFRQGARTIVAPGFWDGDGTYRIRFSPPTEGE